MTNLFLILQSLSVLYNVLICFWFPQMKTVSVALVLCLNIPVDPPDIVKTQPCARLEAWIGEALTVVGLHILYPYTYQLV